jgi:hypothetical protein
MTTGDKLRPHSIPMLAAFLLLAPGPWSSSARANDPAPLTKGPEVSTIGTTPYLGPLPEELAKLARFEAAAGTSPQAIKDAVTATITKEGGNVLTPEELAKVAALPPIPLIQLPAMQKLELMNVPKEGIPDLTAQERDKRAAELSAPPISEPATPASETSSGDTTAPASQPGTQVSR